MSASADLEVFGPNNDPRVTVHVPLAMNLLSDEGSCEIIINSRGIDKASWFDIYASARALEAMCIAKSEGGISIGQGTGKSIFVILSGGS